MEASYANSSAPNITAVPWSQFLGCEADISGFVFYFGVKVFNFAIGLPANLVVMWLILRKASDSSTSDIFIVNLAVLDACFCVMTPVELLNRLLLNDERIWYAQRFSYGLKDVTPLFLTCICLDRYVAVVHPITFTKIKDRSYREVCAAAVWGFTIAYSLTKSILGIGSIVEAFSIVILTCFTIMVFCNLSILWALRRSVLGKEEMHPMKKKAFKMVLNILAIIVFNYLPPVALFPFQYHFPAHDFKCYISVFLFSFMDLSCSIEPVLYISKMDKPNSSGKMCCFPKKP
ncbi:proteinase-activated receptor 3-like [Lepisosteus oculatus]|uniref:proteinase-activated receptor 3-like n=1 Tax=Lepisosteus oculatus TaxID=7918 RepID=UPI00371B0B73